MVRLERNRLSVARDGAQIRSVCLESSISQYPGELICEDRKCVEMQVWPDRDLK